MDNIQATKADWKQSVAKDTAPISRKGYLSVGITLGVFLFWALFFPISGAVVTQGKVISSGQNKLLQHPTGGVVKQIAVKDGAELSKGDLVAVIQPEAALADFAQLTATRDLLLARKSRLEATKTGKIDHLHTGSINLGDIRGRIIAKKRDANEKIYAEQRAQLSAANQRFNSEKSALENQLYALVSEAGGVDRQIVKSQQRVDTLNEQVAKMTPLAEQGYIAKSRLWDTQATQLEASSRLASLEASYNSLESRIEEIRDQIDVLDARKNQDNSIELTEVLAELASIEERISAARKQVEYSEIRAPVSGVLTNLALNTIGGVVSSNTVIAEIVPEGQPLEIEGRIMPADITSVNVGQDAKITITAFNARLVDQLDGKVTYVSADSSIDENTGEAYFTARLEMNTEDPAAVKIMKDVKNGMYAQVYIQTEARTFMSYVMTPLSDSLKKAFKEK